MVRFNATTTTYRRHHSDSGPADAPSYVGAGPSGDDRGGEQQPAAVGGTQDGRRCIVTRVFIRNNNAALGGGGTQYGIDHSVLAFHRVVVGSAHPRGERPCLPAQHVSHLPQTLCGVVLLVLFLLHCTVIRVLFHSLKNTVLWLWLCRFIIFSSIFFLLFHT